jgi:4-amino-4-deoxy-L-arabinose transferase-like glycosyltransferase
MSQAQRTKNPEQRKKYKNWILIAVLLLTAFAFRFYVARYLANDHPADGELYALMARNVIEQHVYSHDDQPPYHPSLIRLPGYPLFLAGIYSVFGHHNNTAVRITQAVIDTCTCALVGILAFYWEPRETRKRVAALSAGALAAICPFTSIYVGTILTETWASFFAVSLCLLTTLAFLARSNRKALWLWGATGLLGGIGVFFRPDSGLFVLAVGLALVASVATRRTSPHQSQTGWLAKGTTVFIQGLILSLAFLLVLVPWTVRNWRVFHLFQPLAPAHAEMPGEFVPRGYLAWVRTWIDDGRYILPVLWFLDDEPISVKDMPESAFDSAEEKARVAQLLDQYNHPPTTEETPSPSPTPPAAPTTEPEESTAAEPDEGDDESGDEEAEEEPEQQTPEMTPAIDAQFAQIARERIARSPLRYYLWLPIKRGWSLWAGPHSDYYPFEGELFPVSELDHSTHQHIWLPFFALLVALYTVLGLAGALVLLRTREGNARRWLLLVALMIFIRLAFFSTIENPEPRYVVEFFPFLSALGGIALSCIGKY